jgi:hypothetical protein
VSIRVAVARTLSLLLALGTAAAAQTTVSRRLVLAPGASMKMWVPDGHVRLLAADGDTLVLTGTIARGGRLFFGGNAGGGKFGVEPDSGVASSPARLVIRVPRGVTVSLKTVTADVDASDVGGWFYTVDGTLRLRGRAATVEAEAMSGTLDVAMDAGWVRARTAGGPLSLGGRVEDASASSVSGRVSITAAGIMRGRFGSVTGAVRFAGTPAPGAVLEFDDHSGAVDVAIPPSTATEFQLTTVAGVIDDQLTSVRPTALVSGRGQSLAFRLGRGGGRITVRTFRGAIVLRRP